MKKNFLILLFVFYSSCIATNIQQTNIQQTNIQQTNTKEPIENIASKIGKCLESKGHIRLAITGIKSLKGESNGFTVWLSEYLTSALSQYPNIHVLERGRLNEIMSEFRLSSGDLFDTDNQKVVGMFRSADVLLIGTVSKIGANFQIILRVVEFETGELIPGCGFDEQIEAPADLKNLWGHKGSLTISVFPPVDAKIIINDKSIYSVSQYKNILTLTDIEPGSHKIKITSKEYEDYERTITVLPLQDKAINAKLFKALKISFWITDAKTGDIIGNKGKIYSGQKYQFCFKTNKDCHVYIVNKGTSGKINTLIPNIKISNNILAEKKKCIPSIDGFQLTGPVGQEKIFVYASVNENKEIDNIVKKNPAHFIDMLDKNRKRTLTKDFITPVDFPSITESTSLDPNDGVFMELIYNHR